MKSTRTIVTALAGIGLVTSVAPGFAADAPASPHTFTANVGIYSQYIYRGITQTARKPAVQGGFDYAHASGLYAGVWASNINWFDDYGSKNSSYTSSASIEMDFYAGYKGSVGDVGYDVGVLQYYYPGTYGTLPAGTVKPDTTEVYGALSYKWVTGKLSYVVSDGLFGVDNADGSYYGDLGANIPLADTWTLNAHVGYQKYDGSNAGVSNSSLYTYTDWKLGITKDMGNGWSATAFYTDTNAKDAGYKSLANKERNLGDSHFVVGISRSF